ncbi:hypothetical protein GXW83_21815 [Streptacidiphilus sp. PB12-B1b]|uniref:hypothetical protein n=1 Tax=Streptacidiphilus sp. PB12-B1b TaxID=2705012 RepID=UPI0015FB0AC8|nr:hypothetical protein [Streptacidiphilus sp. PB12-B1b]QMU77938.1 hypothetical protein GXW83_21815 [Streptacidiphilus sp. PB12-B1b]
MATSSTGTISVDPQALKTFANNIQSLATSLDSGSLASARVNLLGVDTNITFGGRGMLPDGDNLKQTIVQYAGTAADNIEALINGISTLCSDLITFAGQYANADALAKASAQDMWNAIGPDLETYFPNITGAQPSTQIPTM